MRSVSRNRYLLVLENGEAADPPGFVVGEPPGSWNVGEVFFTGSGAFFRILAMDGPPEGDVPEAESWDGVWTVAPVPTAGLSR